jgi:hypothetical protein
MGFMMLAFDTEQKAIIAEAQISQNFGCPIVHENGYTMLKWADVRRITDTIWVIPEPAQDKMTGVVDYTIITQEEINDILNGQ